jgi:hypothetical protein
MKGMSSTLLALAFVFFSLLSLVSVKRTSDSRFVQLGDRESKVSEIGLRFNMQAR